MELHRLYTGTQRLLFFWNDGAFCELWESEEGANLLVHTPTNGGHRVQMLELPSIPPESMKTDEVVEMCKDFMRGRIAGLQRKSGL